MYNDRDLKILWGRSGGRCSFPDCNEELLIGNSVNSIIGDIAHIVARSSNGPRGDENFPKDKLHVHENMILLCKNHHTIVDGDPGKYTISELKKMKAAHEDNVRSKLSQGSRWECNVSQLYYVNIPRLSILAVMQGIDVDITIPENVKLFYSLGFIAHHLSKFTRVLNRLQLNARDLTEIENFSNSDIGSTLSFNRGFRTKNVKSPYDYEQKGFAITGDLKKDPHLYYKKPNFKLMLTLDVKWMTTSTSFGDFASGQVSVAGLCTIKHIKNDGSVYATPLVIGTPKSSWDTIK